MSFTNATGTPERERIVAGLRQATQKTSYAPNPYQIFDNMDSDPQIPDVPAPNAPMSRFELINILEANNPANDAETLDLVCEFCHDHTQEGETDNVATSATLGRVHEVTNLADQLQATRAETLDQTIIRIRRLVRITNPGNRLKLQKREFAPDKLSKYQMWSFYDDQQLDDPFSDLGDSREATVVRFGLGFYDDHPAIELIRWTHRLPPDIIALKPTAWDADTGEWSVYWRPTGKTWPTRGGFGDGFPEVVHDPITAQGLVMAMEPLEI